MEKDKVYKVKITSEIEVKALNENEVWNRLNKRQLDFSILNSMDVDNITEVKEE